MAYTDPIIRAIGRGFFWNIYADSLGSYAVYPDMQPFFNAYMRPKFLTFVETLHVQHDGCQLILFPDHLTRDSWRPGATG